MTNYDLAPPPFTAEPPPSDDSPPCVLLPFLFCDTDTNTCVRKCYPHTDSPPPPSPPPPPSSADPTSQTHVAPFLIATVCILGLSFLLLTTCTIILRFRFTRRRSNNHLSPSRNSGDSPIDLDDDPTFVDHPIWHITTVGLQQSVIDSITAFKYKKLDGLLTDGSDCSVCLSQFDDGDDLRLLPKCSHAFHVTCIDTWLRSHKNCPVCRAPVVNESLPGITEDVEVSVIPGEASSSSSRGGGDGDHFRELSGLEGIRIAEILKKNRELRILSDLSVNYRLRKVGDEDEESGDDVVAVPVRRSFSFNGLAATAVRGVVSSKGKSEGSSSSSGGNTSSGGGSVEEEKGREVGKVAKRGTSMSGLLTFKSSSSIGRTLQKGPVSMKRSLSSGGKLFSFRRTKSQASVLPL